MLATPIRIAPPQRSGPGRVEALVDGHPVWFEADPPDDGIPLAAAPEGWASAFVIPALHHRRALVVEGAVDERWAINVRRLAHLARRAWGYRRQALVFDPDGRSGMAPAGCGHGLFFTAGVDSFHALLRSGERVDTLVNVHGFDVAADDHARQRAVRETVDAVAEARGVRTLFLRTNLREHPLFAATPWDAAHGGALAAAGHVLSGVLARVTIASSQARWTVYPWGSNWRTDPLWSSSTIEFVHADPDIDRLAKVQAIAADPLVRRHLRVCWLERGPRHNCSRCEKCMLTMLALETVGARLACETFEPVDLLDLVRTRARSRWRLPMLHEIARAKALDPGLRREVRAMWWRSVLWRSPVLRWVGGAGRRFARRRR